MEFWEATCLSGRADAVTFGNLKHFGGLVWLWKVESGCEGHQAQRDAFQEGSDI